MSASSTNLDTASFKRHCRLMHVKELCSESECEIKKCSRRHPRECRYYRDYNRCKFGEYCFFSHDTINQSNVVINTSVEKMESKVKVIEKQVEEMKEQILKLTKLLDSKTSDIINLEIKVNRVEKESSEEKIKSDKLESKIKEVEENNFILIHAVDDVEKATKVIKHQLTNQQPLKFTCNICGEEFVNDSLMRNHIRRSHETFKT